KQLNKELVQKLITNQLPEYSQLSIYQVEKSGHDNRTFCLGDKMTVRLPSGKDERATNDRLSFSMQFAANLAGFLKEFQAIDASNGPVAGKHNFYRGGDLSVYHEETQIALKKLKSVLPTDKLNKNVWVHGDIAVGNLLVKNGKLCGVIDFGMLGVGDPSCDYAIAWTFFDKESRKTFFEEMGCDKNTWNRARG
ncbi:12595_t:CDS:2, partial [Racocetra persica]